MSRSLGGTGNAMSSNASRDQNRREMPDIHKYNLILELLGGLITTKRRLVWLSRKDSMLVTGYDIRLFDL